MNVINMQFRASRVTLLRSAGSPRLSGPVGVDEWGKSRIVRITRCRFQAKLLPDINI